MPDEVVNTFFRSGNLLVSGFSVSSSQRAFLEAKSINFPHFLVMQ
jgi:hypothetical protein